MVIKLNQVLFYKFNYHRYDIFFNRFGVLSTCASKVKLVNNKQTK